MTAEPLNVLVCHPRLYEVIDFDSFAARFPGVKLSTVAYEIPHDQLVARAERPAEALPDHLTDQQRQAFASAEVVLALNIPLHRVDTIPRLRWLQGVGSGIGQFMASEVSGVLVTNAAGVAAPQIAEWVVAQIFAIYKRLPLHIEQQRHHQWRQAPGSLVMGRPALVVGVGAVGREVATRLDALGLTVRGVRRRVLPGDPLPRGLAELHTSSHLIEMARKSEVVVAAVPGSTANEDLFDEDFFAAMPADSVFVNIGRGSSVDEAALIAALRSGHLRGAAVDVAKHEPLPADDALWDAPNLYISPHSSASGDGYMERLWDLFCDNLQRFLAGAELRNLVDMDAEYGRAV